MRVRQRGHDWHKERGSALALALLAVTVIAVLGAGFVSVSGSLAKRQAGEVEKAQAFYLAEAGLAESFHAVRMDRTGQIGSEQLPAVYGDGLIWVDVSTGVDGQLELRSNALYGASRASLALVVEPVKLSLGFFGDEGVVVESVVLVDGFNSQQSTYSSQLSTATITVDPNRVGLIGDPDNQIMFYGDKIYRYVSRDGLEYQVDVEVDSDEFLSELPEESLVTPVLLELMSGMSQSSLDLALAHLNSMNEDGGASSPVLEAMLSMAPNVGGSGGQQQSVQGPTTGGGGLIGSNGDVTFENAAGDPVEVFGDIKAGPEGEISGLDGITVTGSTEPFLQEVELPEVVVPNVALKEDLVHDGILPLLISTTAVGYSALTVAADAELIIRGPSTVVIGDLQIEPGATMTLDTRDGDVDLFVTGGMDLAEGSFVITENSDDNTTSIQVAESQSALDQPILLGASSQFHGTVYAPLADVVVGSEFEVFGGVVASRLKICGGARLHFDDVAIDGSPIPSILGWRIVEVPRTVVSMRDARKVLGIEDADLLPLHEAHDLSAIQLSVSYVGLGGVAATYSGPEEGFDWSQVREVVEIRRQGPEDEEPEPAGPDLATSMDADLSMDLNLTGAQAAVRVGVQGSVDAVNMFGWAFGGDLFVMAMDGYYPLSAEEWAAIEALPDGLSNDNQQIMRDRDIDAGGTGGSN